MSNPKVAILLILVFVIIITLLFARCTVVRSFFDGVNLVYQFNTNIKEANTPTGFVVTPQEIRKITPLTKYGWNIYADKEFYYLSKGIQRMFTKTGDNSCLAKKNGVKIAGRHRADFELVINYMAKKEMKGILPRDLMDLMDK